MAAPNGGQNRYLSPFRLLLCQMNRVMTPRARQFYRDVHQAHERFLRRVHDIDSAYDYLEAIGVLDGVSETPEEFEDVLEKNEIAWDVFFRVSPALDQDIVLASTNPGMQEPFRTELFSTDDEYGRQNEASGNVLQKAWKFATGYDGFLRHSGNQFDTIIVSLMDAFESLPSPDSQPFDEYIDVPEDGRIAGQVYDDIHFTRTCKLASPDTDHLKRLDKIWEISYRSFRQEVLNVIEPQLVVCSGKHGWRALYHAVKQNQWDIQAFNESTVTRKFSAHNKGGARGGVYYVPAIDLWIVTTKLATYPVQGDRFRNNLAVVAEHTAF